MENGAVKAADTQVDWQAVRAQSLRPHGFGDERVRLWPRLLYLDEHDLQNLSVATEASVATSEDVYTESAPEGQSPNSEKPHQDERQIALDTDRSFVLYPVEDSAGRERLQAGLNRLIVSVFRRRPRLHYFQGYHDIVSVLFLTLPKELHIPVTEKMSLHRVRDSMGTTLEPVVGLLRILKKLLHLADEKFAETLERAAPLPYYALSNLLTLFSHDIPTLPLIQHIFDYLLSRPPIAVVYLAAALTLTRREEVKLLEDEGEDGMMHSLLTGLPDLYEEDPIVSKEEPPTTATLAEDPMLLANAEAADSPETPAVEASTNSLASDDNNGFEETFAPTPADPEVAESIAEQASELAAVVPDQEAALDNLPRPDGEPADEVGTASAAQHTGIPPSEPEEVPSPQPQAEVKVEPEEPALSEKVIPSRSASPEPLEPARLRRPRVSMTALLTHADKLYARFPPEHPGIAVSRVMGPQSAMCTWSERRADLPDDDEAELMVTRPELVVLPYVEPDDDDEELVSDADSFRGKDAGKGASEKERRRRRLRKPRRRLTDVIVRRKTMVAGAVLVLGVAMAVYGFNAGLPGAGGGHHRSGFGREWRKVGKFLGGAFVGAGERVLEGIRHGLQ
ncbi:rab-GTPase-TBC domain-containing protein [Trametes elegans]|nr:rab-GTPase-TBC domain-containing protein [Trametes elegans]